ncbi:hypothetical protein HGRIS_000056 [Hohenbuehelia grisea]|uniref:Uncharacterized protein n=1 Tax=Hohenbuehelia grisea TaxID=104357 RepID=A0ABR3JR92_9AGAR
MPRSHLKAGTSTYSFSIPVGPTNASSNESVLAALQLPSTNSGSDPDKTGDVEYTIDYQETLQLVTDQGTNSTEFNAAYKETFKLIQSQQSGDTETSKMTFTIKMSQNALDVAWWSGTKIQTRAFSLFRTQDMAAWPATFTFGHALAPVSLPNDPSDPYITKNVDVSIDPGFSALGLTCEARSRSHTRSICICSSS